MSAGTRSRFPFRAATLSILVVLVAVSVFLWITRSTRPMLYYYGAALEVPQGRAIPVLNPFRPRHDEATAESLIQALRTGRCEEIARERLQTEASDLCPVMRANRTASLVWVDPEYDGSNPRYTRTLVYDLPDSRARLFVYFRLDEVGWGVSTVNVLR